MKRLRGGRLGAIAVLVYGLITLGFGVFELIVHDAFVQAFQGGLFVAIGLLAVAGGVVWLRVRGRSAR